MPSKRSAAETPLGPGIEAARVDRPCVEEDETVFVQQLDLAVARRLRRDPIVHLVELITLVVREETTTHALSLGCPAGVPHT